MDLVWLTVKKQQLLDLLPEQFEHRIEACEFPEDGNPDDFEDTLPFFVAVLRVNFTSSEDCRVWLKRFSEKTATGWIVACQKKNPKRYAYRKDFLCQHANKNKSWKKQNIRHRGCGCPAKLDFKIKFNTKGTRRNDDFISDGYKGVVRLNFLHNHPVGTAEALSFLRISPIVKQEFWSYFDAGLDVKEARRVHQEHLLAVNSHLHPEDQQKLILDASQNPLPTIVYHLFEKWRREHPEESKKKKRAKRESAEWALEVEEVDPVGLPDSPPSAPPVNEVDEALFETVWDLFFEKLQTLASNRDALNVFKRSLEEVTTSDQMTHWLLRTGAANEDEQPPVLSPAAADDACDVDTDGSFYEQNCMKEYTLRSSGTYQDDDFYVDN